MTINVVCRRDAINRNRLAPLALVFTHDRRRKFVGLGISEALVHWDFDKQQPTADCPDRAEIQFQITSKIREYEKKIKKLEVLEIPVTFDTLFEQNGKRINCTVGEYFKQIIERLEKVEKYSSASKHKVTLVLVSQFRSVNMRFDELDLTYLREFEIFLSQKGNVNNSCNYAAFQYCRLYLIEILHQTTTHCKCIQFTLCCILSKFYIKPQLNFSIFDNGFSCILSKFYIKPQLARQWLMVPCVVSYRNSTSNHNGQSAEVNVEFVVSYRNSTSNHNTDKDGITDKKLYLIEILHQTTTVWPTFFVSRCCILSKFYIKPQLIALSFSLGLGCILSKFYIKPQHTGPCPLCSARCILSKFYIKPQPMDDKECLRNRCILSKFYIKPQLVRNYYGYSQVVSYRNSTSNHNRARNIYRQVKLYLIEILHQTTTNFSPFSKSEGLYLIEILHQTTTALMLLCLAVLLYLIEILHQTTTFG